MRRTRIDPSGTITRRRWLTKSIWKSSVRKERRTMCFSCSPMRGNGGAVTRLNCWIGQNGSDGNRTRCCCRTSSSSRCAARREGNFNARTQRRRETGERGIRRGWVPQPAGRGNLAPTMDTAPPIVPHLAPEGQHVYSTRHTPNTLKPQRGDRCALSQSRIQRIERRRDRLHLAPAGQHVYSTHGIHKYPKAPEGRQVRFVSITD